MPNDEEKTIQNNAVTSVLYGFSNSFRIIVEVTRTAIMFLRLERGCSLLHVAAVVPEGDGAGGTGGGQVDETLVGGAPETEGNVFEVLLKLSIDEDVAKGKHFFGDLRMTIGALRQKVFIEEARKGPNVFLWKPFLALFEKVQESPLVLRFKGISPEKGEALGINVGQFRKNTLFRGVVKLGTVVEVPGLGLEAAFAGVGATGDKEGHPDAGTVGNVIGLDFTVIHRLTSF